MRKIRIATRRSDLAVTQSSQAARFLREKTGVDFELVPMSSTGDKFPDRALNAFDRKGIFLDSLREALLDKDVDLAIHSYKDVPSDSIDGLAISATPPRVEPRDVLVSREGFTVHSLPEGAVVGTSSARRKAQLLSLRPDIRVEAIRGNVPTRMKRCLEDLDAVILAGAGLLRLAQGVDGPVSVSIDEAFEKPLSLDVKAVPISIDEMVPPAVQGVLALEHRSDDEEIIDLLAKINDEKTQRAAELERALLLALGGGCSVPLGVYALVNNDLSANVHVFSSLGESAKRQSFRVESDALAKDFASHAKQVMIA